MRKVLVSFVIGSMLYLTVPISGVSTTSAATRPSANGYCGAWNMANGWVAPVGMALAMQLLPPAGQDGMGQSVAHSANCP